MKKITLQVLGIILLASIFAVYVYAGNFGSAARYEFYDETPNNAWRWNSDTTCNAQSFQVGINGTNETFAIKGVSLSMYGNGEDVNLNVTIKAVDANLKPTGNALSMNYTFTGDNIPLTSTWINITLTDNVLLKGGAYSIVTCPVGVASLGNYWESKNEGAYNGTAWRSADGGATWTTMTGKADTDFLFQIWGIPLSTGEYNQSFSRYTTEGVIENFSAIWTIDAAKWNNASGYLIYDGTSYLASNLTTATSYQIQLNKTLTIPYNNQDNFQNKSFYWALYLGNSTGIYNYNSTYNNQTINTTSTFVICNQTINASYLNLSIQDETTLSQIPANVTTLSLYYWISNQTLNKSYTYSNLIGNYSYVFCYSPSVRDVNVNLSMTYSASSYPQRSYTLSGVLANITTNKTLYLLGSSSGIYTSFQIVGAFGDPVSGVNVEARRQFSGVWTLVEQGTTDDAGLVTFWVNPNYDHQITATYGTLTTTQTIRPTQSLYTISLSAETNGTYVSPVKGIYWVRTPSSGLLANGTYTFQFNVTSQLCNLDNIKMELLNQSDDGSWNVVQSNTTACDCSGNLSIVYNFQEQELKGRYYADTGDGYFLIESDGDWKKLPIESPSNVGRTFRDFINFLSDPRNWVSNCDDLTDNNCWNSDDYRRWEFTKITGFFIIFALIIAALNISFNFDLVNPGIFLFGFPLVVILLSAGNGLAGPGLFYIQGATPFGQAVDNYVVALYVILIAGTFYFATMRRET